MDPAFIALFGTLLGGLFLKTVEHYCSRAKTAVLYGNEAGTESIAHKTRMMEKECFPDWHAEWYTKCECLKCNPPAVPQPVKSPSGMYTLPRVKNEPYHFDPMSERYERIVDGYVFMVPVNVPREAKAHYDPYEHYGTFMWHHPDGRVQSLKLVPRMDIEPASVYADQYEKPVLQVKPRRTAPRIETERAYK